MSKELTIEQKQMYIGEIIKCEICFTDLSNRMETPIRCPGMDYRNINGKSVAYTTTGIPWDEYIQGFKKRDRKRWVDYFMENKQHIDKHHKEIADKIKELVA